MKVYLAASYCRHRELQGYAEELRAKGITVRSRWHQGGHELPQVCGKEEWEALGQRFAREDLQDLDESDTLVLFTDGPLAAGRGRGGRHVEFGYALATGLRLFIVGPRENVFHCLGCVTHLAAFADLLTVKSLEAGVGVVPAGWPHRPPKKSVHPKVRRSASGGGAEPGGS